MTEEDNKTHTPYANCADTAEHLIFSLPPNISFVSESFREHKKIKSA